MRPTVALYTSPLNKHPWLLQGQGQGAANCGRDEAVEGDEDMAGGGWVCGLRGGGLAGSHGMEVWQC